MGMMVTLRLSLPLESSSLPVSAESTTTLYSLPPAETSRAVIALGSLTVMSSATRPWTFRRSKPLTGSAYLNSSCESLASRPSTRSVALEYAVCAVLRCFIRSASFSSEKSILSSLAWIFARSPEVDSSVLVILACSAVAPFAAAFFSLSVGLRCEIFILACSFSVSSPVSDDLTSWICSANVLVLPSSSAAMPSDTAWRRASSFSCSAIAASWALTASS
mmetsp:Transcript_20953/g.54508  ORF Transcript_20953/g.54508 Transcript_20953/m.54508 type:complete len:220 (-) Transcript_20953:1245-1904(-)